MTFKKNDDISQVDTSELKKENLVYYRKMVFYLGLSQIDETSRNELLDEIRDHLLSAQKDGKTAQDIFGDEPDYYKELVKGLPHKNKTILIIKIFMSGFISVFGILVGFGLLGLVGNLYTPIHFINDGFSLIQILWIFCIAYLTGVIISALIKKALFKFKRYIFLALIVYLGLIIISFCMAFLPEFLPIPDKTISINPWLSLSVGLGGWISSIICIGQLNKAKVLRKQ